LAPFTRFTRYSQMQKGCPDYTFLFVFSPPPPSLQRTCLALWAVSEGRNGLQHCCSAHTSEHEAQRELWAAAEFRLRFISYAAAPSPALPSLRAGLRSRLHYGK
jgi:hypothetical protein